MRPASALLALALLGVLQVAHAGPFKASDCPSAPKVLSCPGTEPAMQMACATGRNDLAARKSACEARVAAANRTYDDYLSKGFVSLNGPIIKQVCSTPGAGDCLTMAAEILYSQGFVASNPEAPATVLVCVAHDRLATSMWLDCSGGIAQASPPVGVGFQTYTSSYGSARLRAYSQEYVGKARYAELDIYW